jgi:transposase
MPETLIFDRDRVAQLRAEGLSIREIAAKLGIGVGTAARTLQAVPKVQSGEVEWNGEGPIS